MKTIQNEIIETCLLHANDEQVKKYLKALELVEIVPSYSTLLIEKKYYLYSYNNIIQNQGVVDDVTIDPTSILKFLFCISDIITINKKWNEVGEYIQHSYTIMKSLDNIIENKYQVSKSNISSSKDPIAFIVLILINNITTINIAIETNTIGENHA